MVPSGDGRGRDDHPRLHRAAARGGGAAAARRQSRPRCGAWRRSSRANAPPEQVFQTVTEEVCRLLGLRTAVLHRFEDARTVDDRRQVRRADRAPSRSATSIELEVGSALRGAANRSARPVELRRARRPGRGRAARARVPLAASACRSRSRASTWGALVVALRQDETLPLETERRLQAFAELVGARGRERAGARRAGRVAPAHRRGERHRAPPARAQPARRRPAAAGRALGRAAARAGQAARPPRRRPRSCSRTLVEELAEALTELRELAQGIHPAVLTERGLEAALEVLAARAPLAGRARRRPARAAAGAGRDGRLLHRLRGARERRQARRTPTRRAVRVECIEGRVDRRDRRRRRRRRRRRPRLRAPRPARPRRDARRRAVGRQRAGPGHRRARRASRPVAQLATAGGTHDAHLLLQRHRGLERPRRPPRRRLRRASSPRRASCSAARSRAAGGREVDCRGDELFCVFDDAGARPLRRRSRSSVRSRRAPGPRRSACGCGSASTAARRNAPATASSASTSTAPRASARPAHGGQILASQEAAGGARRSRCEELGEFEFRGLREPERIFQLVADDLPSRVPAAPQRPRARARPLGGDRRRLDAAARGPRPAARGRGDRRRRPGRERRRAAAQGAQLPPRRRDRRHPHAADADRRGDPGGPRDPREAPRDRRARPLPVRRAHLRRRAALRQRRGTRLPAQGPRRRRRRVHRRGPPRRRRRLGARPASSSPSWSAATAATTRSQRSRRASARCSS